MTTDAYTPSPVGALDVSNASTTAVCGIPGLAARSTPRAPTIARWRTIGYNGTNDQLPTWNAYSGNNEPRRSRSNGIFIPWATPTSATPASRNWCPGNSRRRPAPAHNPARSASSTPPRSATQADKVIKDNNFRGETIYNNTLYVTKGSGSNGIDTVYQVGAGGCVGQRRRSCRPERTITVLPGFPTDAWPRTTGRLHPVRPVLRQPRRRSM